MYCIRCGSQLKDGTRYCIYCGAPTAAVRKERPRPTEDTVSIPIDFFSSRLTPDEQDDFTIPIPADFIHPEAAAASGIPDEAGDIAFTRMATEKDIREAMAEQRAEPEETPDEVGDIDFTRMVAKEDIREAMAEQHAEPEETPDEAGDIDFTRMVAKEDIREAMAEQHAELEETPDEAGNIDFTRMVAKEDIREAMAEQHAEPEETPDEAGDINSTRVVAKEDIREAMAEQHAEPEDMQQVDVHNIPDIPIPSDFVIEDDVQFGETASADEGDDGAEQLMSRRGVIFVVIVVVLLFAIAVGACMAALRGDASAAEGSGSAEIGFWSSGEE